MNALFTLADVLAPVKRALRLTAEPDLSLARARIDTLHRELCALTDWPALRATLPVSSAAGASVAIPGAAGVMAVFRTTGGAPYWFCESFDVHASDLSGRALWSLGAPSRNLANDLLVDVWEWSSEGSVHVPSTGVPLLISYWRRPEPLAQDTDRIALPVTRALVVMAILDLVGLMDRKDVDVAPWREELGPSMDALRQSNPAAPTQLLRLPSGRLLTRSPLRV